MTRINRRFWLYAARFIHHGGRALTTLPLLVIYAAATILESTAHALDAAVTVLERVATAKPNTSTNADTDTNTVAFTPIEKGQHSYGDSNTQASSACNR